MISIVVQITKLVLVALFGAMSNVFVYTIR